MFVRTGEEGTTEGREGRWEGGAPPSWLKEREVWISNDLPTSHGRSEETF